MINVNIQNTEPYALYANFLSDITINLTKNGLVNSCKLGELMLTINQHLRADFTDCSEKVVYLNRVLPEFK